MRCVDVFIRKIDAACECDFSVDGDDLSVVPAILRCRKQGLEFVENDAADAGFFELFRIILGKTQEASDVVVNDTDIDTLGDLAFQNFKNAVPHDAFLDDEKFKKDIRPCFFQLGQERRMERFSRGKIFCPCVFIYGKASEFVQIFDLSGMRGNLFRYAVEFISHAASLARKRFGRRV